MSPKRYVDPIFRLGAVTGYPSFYCVGDYLRIRINVCDRGISIAFQTCLFGYPRLKLLGHVSEYARPRRDDS